MSAPRPADRSRPPGRRDAFRVDWLARAGWLLLALYTVYAVGRLDFNLESVPEGFKEAVEAACNVEVEADRGISAYELPRDEAFAIPDIIRTATNLLPPTIEIVRIVDIDGLDVQADGGTHVASTRQVGRMRVAKVENKGKGFRRIRIALEP